jgi:uncharacterized membrane protein YdjX (TVP38/TMEM64 family)
MTSRRRRIPWKWVGAGLAMAALSLAWGLLPLDEWVRGLQERVEHTGVRGAVVFALAYVAAGLLFVPGSVLTIAAGVLFGLGWGTLVASAASTATAAAAFLIARYASRARVERAARRHRKFAAFDRAAREQGWKVVALLRLSPLVPFSLSNYLFGLTAVGFWPYLLASWAAMLPGTLLYVWLGAAGRMAARGGDRSVWEWMLLGAGLAATGAVTVILGRAARRQLTGRYQEKSA